MTVSDDQCRHDSCTGDEGPAENLPGRNVVRWRCDGCGAVIYSDAALAAVRVELQAARDEAAAARRTLTAEREKAHGWEEALHRLLRHIRDLGDRVLAHSMSTQHNVAAGCCMDCHWTAAAVPETRDKETT